MEARGCVGWVGGVSLHDKVVRAFCSCPVGRRSAHRVTRNVWVRWDERSRRSPAQGLARAAFWPRDLRKQEEVATKCLMFSSRDEPHLHVRSELVSRRYQGAF